MEGEERIKYREIILFLYPLFFISTHTHSTHSKIYKRDLNCLNYDTSVNENI